MPASSSRSARRLGARATDAPLCLGARSTAPDVAGRSGAAGQPATAPRGGGADPGPWRQIADFRRVGPDVGAPTSGREAAFPEARNPLLPRPSRPVLQCTILRAHRNVGLPCSRAAGHGETICNWFRSLRSRPVSRSPWTRGSTETSSLGPRSRRGALAGGSSSRPTGVR